MKKGKGSEDIWTLNPHCDLDLEDRHRKLPHNSPACNDAPLYQIWLQTVKQNIGYMEY